MSKNEAQEQNPQPLKHRDRLRAILAQAINKGYRLFNDGEPRQCAELYEDAARRGIEECEKADDGEVENLAWEAVTLREGLHTAAISSGKDDWVDAAWCLRRAFDAVLLPGKKRGGEEDRSGEGTAEDSVGELADDPEEDDGMGGVEVDEMDKGVLLADVMFLLLISVPTSCPKSKEGDADHIGCRKFVASEAVDTMLILGVADGRDDAVLLGKELETEGLIVAVDDDAGDADGPRFEDDHDRVYKFWSQPDPKEEVTGPQKILADMLSRTAAPEGDNYSMYDEIPITSDHPARREGTALADFVASLETSVDIKDRKWRLKTYPRCFVGNEAVDVAVRDGLATSRSDAVKRIDHALQAGLLHHVTREHNFKDAMLFYEFSNTHELQDAITDIRSSADRHSHEMAIRGAALAARLMVQTSPDVTKILNEFYGCDNGEEGWDATDINTWRLNMRRWGFGRAEHRDDAMVKRLEPVVAAIEPDQWEAKLKADESGEWESPWGILAQIALFDQIPRSAYRGTSRAFRWDDLAKKACKRGLELGYFDTAYKSTLNRFLHLLPLEHSEIWEEQQLSVMLMLKMLSTEAIKDEDFTDEEVVMRLEFSKRLSKAFLEHAQVVAKFKRQPHRNAALGRKTTLEERLWLASDLVPIWARSQGGGGGPRIPLRRWLKR